MCGEPLTTSRCAVSEFESLLTTPPWSNRWLLAGVALPLILHFAVLYTPVLAAIFQLSPLTRSGWLTVAAFSLPLVLLEEMIKLYARKLNIE